MDHLRKYGRIGDVGCLVFQKKEHAIRFADPFYYDFDRVSRDTEPLLTYEPVSSDSAAHIFHSYVAVKAPDPDGLCDFVVDNVKVNLCRPAGGLAVGLSHSIRRHLGVLEKKDCVSFIGPMNSMFGTYYSLLAPLLVGAQTFINEHSDLDLETLMQSVKRSDVSVLILSSKLARE